MNVLVNVISILTSIRIKKYVTSGQKHNVGIHELIFFLNGKQIGMICARVKTQKKLNPQNL